MNSANRIFVFATLLIVAIGILFFIPYPEGDEINETAKSTRFVIVSSAFVLLSFSALLLEHWFTKPTDALASSISGILLIGPSHIALNEMGVWYPVLLGYLILIAISASVSIILYEPALGTDNLRNKVSDKIKKFLGIFGRSKIIYGLIFFSALAFYTDSDEPFFLAAMLFALVVVAIDPSNLGNLFAGSDTGRETEIGEIIGVQSKRTILARLHENRPLVKRFDVVEFLSPDDSERTQKGLIIDNLVLDAQQWVKVLSGTFFNNIVGPDRISPELRAGHLNLIRTETTDEFLEKFVGTATEGSSIMELKFEASGKVSIREGALLQAEVDGSRVLYQVTEGVTDVKVLEKKNEAGLVIGHAAQVGTWDNAALKFDRFGWVPEMSTPVQLANDIVPPATPAGEMIIGHIPGTNYPIFGAYIRS